MSDPEVKVRETARDFAIAVQEAIDHGLRVDLPAAWDGFHNMVISETGKVKNAVVGVVDQVGVETQPQPKSAPAPAPRTIPPTTQY